MKKNNKWMRGLDRDLVREILELEPVGIAYLVKWHYIVFCEIKGKNGDTGTGVAICSVVEGFDLNRGKNAAAGRARKALEKQRSSNPIRIDWRRFSDSWTKSQIRRVTGYSRLGYKSIYLAKGEVGRPIPTKLKESLITTKFEFKKVHEEEDKLDSTQASQVRTGGHW